MYESFCFVAFILLFVARNLNAFNVLNAVCLRFVVLLKFVLYIFNDYFLILQLILHFFCQRFFNEFSANKLKIIFLINHHV